MGKLSPHHQGCKHQISTRQTAREDFINVELNLGKKAAQAI
jgi:hypothetical protein